MKVHILQPPNRSRFISFTGKFRPGDRTDLWRSNPNPAEYCLLVGGVPSREFVAAWLDLKSIIIPWAVLPTSTRVLMLDFPEIACITCITTRRRPPKRLWRCSLAAAKFVIPYDKSLVATIGRYAINPILCCCSTAKLLLILRLWGHRPVCGKVLKAMICVSWACVGPNGNIWIIMRIFLP